MIALVLAILICLAGGAATGAMNNQPWSVMGIGFVVMSAFVSWQLLLKAAQRPYLSIFQDLSFFVGWALLWYVGYASVKRMRSRNYQIVSKN